MRIHLSFFFFSFFLGSLHNWKQQRRLMFLWPSSTQSSMHIYGIREQLCSTLSRGGGSVRIWFIWGGEVGVGVEVQISEGGVRWKPNILGFCNRKLQLTEGTGEEGQIKKYTSSFLLQPHQWIEHSAGGDVCQGLLIRLVPPVLFLNPSADFIPGML